jgi:hypothetical protein
MSKSYLVPHDFQSVNIGSLNTTLNVAGSTFVAGANVSGELVTLNATGGSAVTVPSLVAGLDLTFVVSNTGAHTITLPSACVYGTVNFPYAGTSGSMLAAASTVISTTAGSTVGDRFKLTSDGTKCYLSGTVSTFNAIKLSP